MSVKVHARIYQLFQLIHKTHWPQKLFIVLGVGLGGLGKTLEACLTLDEVALRYPNSPHVAEANAARLNLDCS